jgi:hypothetical protein
MPVTSMRDLQFYNNDLIVATHGRGFWIIDDMSPLRQLDAAVTRDDAFLFKPADVINVVETTDNGTPLQKDEPHAENPPTGPVIDYYLKSVPRTPVKIEILDAGGAVVQTFSSDPAASRAVSGAQQATSNLPRVSPLWQTSPLLLSTSPGMHRVAWTALRPRPRGAAPADDGGPLDRRYAGNFTARLSVNGKTWTQPFVVKPDPRIPR